jgi:hypothetical protein
LKPKPKKEQKMLDKTFANEIRKAGNGDGSREYKFALLEELKKVSGDLAHRYEFDNCVKKFGRAKVALCVAATIFSAVSRGEDRYERPQITWANAVMSLWTNRYSGNISEAIINIHPAILADNSYRLRKLTVDEIAG